MALRENSRPAIVVFVHGWSVRSADTYGKLPERIVAAASAMNWTLEARHVFLGKYVSFRDEVTVHDLARGFDHALRSELGDALSKGQRFACITHSTGGPVIRHWWRQFYPTPGAPACPMSHLVMLAPANFGSALAQLGKGRVSRLKSWFDHVEPGTGVLDWLELGSPESWALNRAWIDRGRTFAATNGVFPFVLTGQAIDRKLYDHVNAYTGEPGSDGVVRAASANLNATYLRLVQRSDDGVGSQLVIDRVKTSPRTAFKIVSRSAHSGRDIGILRSVKDDGDHPTVEAVVRCLAVSTPAQYAELTKAFEIENGATQFDERVDIVTRRLLPDSVYLIDQFSMVLFRIRDDQDNQIGEFDLKLTAVPADARGAVKASPDLLPTGFLQDRQRNRRSPDTLTFFLNQDLMTGCQAITHPKQPNVVLRDRAAGLKVLGLQIVPHLSQGFVHFVPAELDAVSATLRHVLKPNQTTLVDVIMKRVVGRRVFQLQRLDERDDSDFTGVSPGEPITDHPQKS